MPVFGQVVTCLVIFQLFMIGILGVKQSYTSLVVLPLLFITLIFTQAGALFRPPVNPLHCIPAAEVCIFAMFLLNSLSLVT